MSIGAVSGMRDLFEPSSAHQIAGKPWLLHIASLYANAQLYRACARKKRRKYLTAVNSSSGVLDDEKKRKELKRAQNSDDLRTSKAWDEMRQVTKPFHQALVKLFLKDDDRLKDLTMEYGIF